ncbi:MAG: aminotransferase class III-fold pyridoxal phosphate-dependent enzyme, partial [Gammaproteobacteria bacterium]|nr:aminotransferase class III-fold pyridoxal phosphate-dependent enzyme [Gammaproteobacteria bacterium]
DNLFAHAAAVGDYMQQRLRQFADHPLVGEVRGKGLIGAIEMVANKQTGEAFSGGAVGAHALQICQDNGVILRAVAGSSLAFCPPLIISRDQIDEIMSVVAKALDSALDYAQAQGLLK